MTNDELAARMSSPAFRRGFIVTALQSHLDYLRVEMRYNPSAKVAAEIEQVSAALDAARRELRELNHEG